jgi:hypothetical protein
MVSEGFQRSSKFVPGNPQGVPRDPRDATMRAEAPPGGRSGASGSTPGPSKTNIFMEETMLAETRLLRRKLGLLRKPSEGCLGKEPWHLQARTS